MSRYQIVKQFFEKGLWTERQVRDAVTKGWITEEEYDKIVGRTEGEDI